MFHHTELTSAKELKPCCRTTASIKEHSHIANTSTCIWEKITHVNATISSFSFCWGCEKNNCACSAWAVLLQPVPCSVVITSMHLLIHRGDYCLSTVIWYWFSIILASWPWWCHLCSLRILRATCPLLVLDEWRQWLVPWVTSVNCCHLSVAVA